MDEDHRSEPPSSIPARLKTCQTCFRAKIRCDRTQDSGSCDRCLRLGKTCTFAPTRRRNPPPRSRMDRLEAKVDRLAGSRTPSPGVAGVRAGDGHILGSSTTVRGEGPSVQMTTTDSFDPMDLGIISPQKAGAVLDIYKTKMTPQFPFVRLPDDVTIDIMRQTRPCLCLATLAAASFEDVSLQQTLSQLFNRVIAARLVHGGFNSLDLLQGLLVHVAWGHYQPRPRKYSQQLHLATSIISDLRLDRPRNPKLWNIDKSSSKQHPDWNSDELRSLIGTYYLTSSSSIILQKIRHFPYNSFIMESSEKLASLAEYPTDRYLQHIVHLQNLSEEIDDIITDAPRVTSVAEVNARIALVREKVDLLKATLTFPLSDCPTMVLQLNALELFISQLSLPGFPFGLNKFQNTITDGPQLVGCLSECISASKSLASFLSTMTPGEEFTLTNIAWIMMSCGLSLAVRLDILARDPRIASMTRHLLRFLDMRHTLRQIMLRLESAATRDNGTGEGNNPFAQLLQRARIIEAWYLRQPGASTFSSPVAQDATCVLPIIGVSTTGQHPMLDTIPTLDTMTGSNETNTLGEQFIDATNFRDFSVMEFLAADGQGMDFNPYLFSTDFESYDSQFD